MRYLLCVCFIFVNYAVLYSQDFLSEMQGLKNDKGEMLYEVSGYTISVYEVKGSVEDEGTLRLVEKAYGLDHILMTYTDSTLRMKNKVIESLIDTPDLPLQISQKCFLLQKDDETITVLYLETSIKRDFVLEEAILHACINGQLSKSVSMSKTASSIPLAGKTISLPFVAEWFAPHSLVYEDSQIRWSEFSSISGANQYIENQILIDEADLEIIEENEMDVLFDQKQVTAREIIYYDPSGDEVSDYLYVYYVVAELRGRFVSCILSYNESFKNETDLPVLLNLVLEIPASNKQDLEPRWSQYLEENRDRFLFDIQLGAELPLGNLHNVYDVAPSLGLNLGYSFTRDMGVDIGVQFSFPANSNNFNYYSGSSITETEVMWFGRLNARWRYQVNQTKKLSSFGYFGAGVVWLTTDIEKEYDSESDSYSYYSIVSPDLFCGFNIRYKFIGLFAEYHFAPYGISDRVKDTFGHSSVRVGLSLGRFWR